MKICYTSDLHLDFYIKPDKTSPQKMKKLIKRLFGDIESSDVLILAGDLSHYSAQTIMFIECIKEYFDKIFIVAGNHEFYNVSKSQEQKYTKLYSKFNELKTLIKPLTDVHFLDGDIVEYKGKTFGGAMGWYDLSYGYRLNTAYGYIPTIQWKMYSNDSRRIPTLKNPLDIFEIEIKKIKSVLEKKPDIIISHFCPVSEGIVFNGKYKTDPTSAFYCFDGLDYIQNAKNDKNIKHWFYGHIHDYKVFDIYETNFYRNPLGYPKENENFKLRYLEI